MKDINAVNTDLELLLRRVVSLETKFKAFENYLEHICDTYDDELKSLHSQLEEKTK